MPASTLSTQHPEGPGSNHCTISELDESKLPAYARRLAYRDALDHIGFHNVKWRAEDEGATGVCAEDVQEGIYCAKNERETALK
jgi:hypothetical protein